MICPVCYSRVQVRDKTDRKRIEAGSGPCRQLAGGLRMTCSCRERGRPWRIAQPCRHCGMPWARCNYVPVVDMDGPESDCCPRCDHGCPHISYSGTDDGHWRCDECGHLFTDNAQSDGGSE